MLLPDLKQLPSLLNPSLHPRQGVSNQGALEHMRKQPVSDTHVIPLFTAKKLRSWGHTQRLHVLYVQRCREIASVFVVTL